MQLSENQSVFNSLYFKMCLAVLLLHVHILQRLLSSSIFVKCIVDMHIFSSNYLHTFTFSQESGDSKYSTNKGCNLTIRACKMSAYLGEKGQEGHY